MKGSMTVVPALDSEIMFGPSVQLLLGSAQTECQNGRKLSEIETGIHPFLPIVGRESWFLQRIHDQPGFEEGAEELMKRTVEVILLNRVKVRLSEDGHQTDRAAKELSPVRLVGQHEPTPSRVVRPGTT